MEFGEHFGLILNIAFTLLMLCLAWFDLKSFGTPQHKDFKSIIMSLGVLGTFVGIFVGLLEFDTLHVNQSIPMLLEGLKVAFYTSIAGMSIAIFLAIMQKMRAHKAKGDEEEGDISLESQPLIATTPEMSASYGALFKNLTHLQEIAHLNTSLQSLHTLIDENNQKQQQQLELSNTHFDSLEKILHSLLEDNQKQNEQLELSNTHAKAIDATLEKNFALIQRELQGAVEELAKGANKGLVSALTAIIKDFNKNLNEQFGQNFQELNHAVEKMVVWQEHYKSAIEQSHEFLERTFKSIQESGQVFETMADRNKEIMEFYSDLKEFINEAAQSSQQLRSNLEVFAHIKDDAKESVSAMKALFENALGHLNALSDHVTSHSDTINTHITNNSNTLKESFVHLGEDFKQFSQTFNGEIVDAYEKVNQHIQQDSALFVENVTKQSEKFNESTQALQLAGEKSLADLKENLENMSQAGLQHFQASLKHNESHFEAIKEDIKKLGTDLKQEANQFSTQISEGIQTTTSAILERLQQESQTSETLFKERQEFMQKQQEITQKGIVASANAMVKQNKSFLEGVGNQTKDFFTQALQEWQKEQQNIVNGVLSEHKRVSESFNTLSNGLHSGFEELKGSLKALLKDIIDDLKQGNEEYNNASLAIMESNITNISQKVMALQELSHQSMDKIANEYITQLKTLMNDSVNIPKEISTEILSEIKALQKNVAANLVSANQSIVDNKNEVRMIIEQINSNLQHELDRTQNINTTLCDSLEKLDKSLGILTQGFKSDYEWFLRRISDFMGSHR